LSEVIAGDPERMLGPAVARRFGGTLPFLMKVLAVGAPLSLQAHPDAEQARAGFAREEAAGIHPDARERSYSDPLPKPELLCALTPFEALCGFRPAEACARLLRELGDPGGLGAAIAADGLPSAFARWMYTDLDRASSIVSEVVAACRDLLHRGTRFARACGTVLDLHARYPGDRGVLAAVLLHPVRLRPGEALFLPPRSPHCYLGGVAIEVMSSSDNVVRGGLTSKHVDVPELLRILTFEAAAPTPAPATATPEGEAAYPEGEPYFRLSRLDRLPGEPPWLNRRSGAEILFCTEGTFQLTTDVGPPVVLSRGSSAFVPASVRSYGLEGAGTVFRSAPGV